MRRMVTVSSGVFTGVDIADAAVRAIKSKDPVTFFLRVNYVGVATFVIACVVDVRATLDDKALDEGESAEELCIRTYRALNSILMDMMENDFAHCAVITHAGVISNMLACFGMPKIPAKDLTVEPGEGYELLFTAQMWQTAQAFEILGMTPYSLG